MPQCSKAIEDALRNRFHIDVLEVTDEGNLHAGHQHQGHGHFRIMIRSSDFSGKTAVEIHRMIYNALQTYLGHGIHALAIDAKPS